MSSLRLLSYLLQLLFQCYHTYYSYYSNVIILVTAIIPMLSYLLQLLFECYHTYYSYYSNVIILITAIIPMLSYLLQLLYEFIFCSFFLKQCLQIFISSWRLYHLVVFIAKLWDDNLILVMPFLLLKLCKFRYLSFLKSYFVCEKKLFFLYL